MSSPKVLTFSRMPHEVAVAGNRDDTIHYLQLARELYEQTLEIQAKTPPEAGGLPPVPPMAYAEAEATAWARFHADPNQTINGVTFAHAYWQSLKHPWHEQVLERYARGVAMLAERLAQEAAIAAQVAQFTTFDYRTSEQAATQSIDMTGVAPILDWNQRIAGTVEAILRATRPEDRETEQERLKTLVSPNPRETWLSLEAERLAVEQQAKRRTEREVARLYQEQHLQAMAERTTRRMERCAERLRQLGGGGRVGAGNAAKVAARGDNEKRRQPKP